eukprot:scaffold126939_cov18-Tisochrysis_lutea.AAC.1
MGADGVHQHDTASNLCNAEATFGSYVFFFSKMSGLLIWPLCIVRKSVYSQEGGTPASIGQT